MIHQYESSLSRTWCSYVEVILIFSLFILSKLENLSLKSEILQLTEKKTWADDSYFYEMNHAESD